MIVALIGSEGRLGNIVKQSSIFITHYFDKGNIENFYLLSSCDVVIHLGEFSDPDISLELALSNVVSSINIIQHSEKIGVRHFIYASSHRRYGSWENTMKHGGNLDKFYPLSFYGASKAYIEDVLRISSTSRKMKSSILRIGTIMNDQLDNNRLENLNHEWRGKYSYTRISGDDFIAFLVSLVSNPKHTQSQVYNLIPEQSELNKYFDGKNINNY